jgi:hypothetical protein
VVTFSCTNKRAGSRVSASAEIDQGGMSRMGIAVLYIMIGLLMIPISKAAILGSAIVNRTISPCIAKMA